MGIKPMTCSLTVAMIVRDEELVLRRCLDSLRNIYDELIVVDTGSGDGSVGIAESYGADVFAYTAANGPDGRIIDFAMARNAALERANGRWILQIDADEVLLAGHEMISTISREDAPDTVAVQIRSEGSVWKSIRLFRRSAVTRYVGAIHEHLEETGTMRMEDGVVIENFPDKLGKESAYGRNVRIAMKEISAGRGNSRTWHFLGTEHLKAGEFARARECYGISLDLGGFPIGQFHGSYYKAVCHFLEGDIDGAAVEAGRSLTFDSQGSEALCLLGDCHFVSDRFEDARECYRQAIATLGHRKDSMFPTQSWVNREQMQQRIELIDRLLAENS